MWTPFGARMRAFGSRGLGVSTFPWGRVTDTRERRSRHSSFYNPKSRVIYLASGYEERVGEVFESRVTRLNAWKGARVQRMHVRARMGERLGVREHARARQGVRRVTGTRACARVHGQRTCTLAHGYARVLFT
ncbi:hypothetical protein CRG98_026424 [Punica granatum]|uniref:Uncharacterized protein n=1 Tax=Punica granatum TaxID=22663 RepID=A0A2I0JAZ7_PUNGR|nr:hypothetical protein CRG98_026424 [Punica granatum]